MQARKPKTQSEPQKHVLPLVLLQDLGELSASGPLRFAGIQTLGANLLLRVTGGIGIQAEQDLLVDEGVLLLDAGALGASGSLSGTDNALDFRRVDQTADISLLDERRWQEEVLLQGRGGGGAAVDVVQGGEGRGRPDHETAKVATRGELEEVQGEDRRGLDTSKVAESANDLGAIDLGVVDDQRATALAVAAATELALTGAQLAGVLDLLDIWGGTDGLQQAGGSGSLGDGSTREDLGVDDEGNLRYVGDLVATGEEEGGNGRGSQGRDGSEAPGGRYVSICILKLAYIPRFERE